LLAVIPELLLLFLAPDGRPLFYWGARPAAVTASAPATRGDEAAVLEVHAALDGDGWILRFTFDRPVREASYLPDGQPVSGRLRAVLYVDVDDDRASGLDHGPQDPRTGADRRIEVGVLSLGADPGEKRAATALVTASLAQLRSDGRQRIVWRGDDSDATQASAHGEWVEVRMPADRVGLGLRARLILAAAERTWEGRFSP
jgi:hypothetical protein